MSPRSTRNLGLGLFLGLIIGVGLAVAREMLDSTLKTGEDVAGVTDAPVLGHVAVDPKSASLWPKEALEESAGWSEAFRVLRTNMQYVEVDHDTRTFVVTSSLPGEGKTTTSVNLAITLALANRSVVLVECDLRRPLIADRMDLDPAVGTTTVLIGNLSADDALQSFSDTGLKVMCSGPIPPNPSELLQSASMEKLLADLRDRFDIVIIDAPPLLPVTDAALLAARADGALVVVSHGRTTRDQLTHAIDRIEAVDAKVVGTVFNRVPQRKRGSSYSYGYGYGYGYGYESERDGPSRRPSRSGKRIRRR